jgi:hypothetical protein
MMWIQILEEARHPLYGTSCWGLAIMQPPSSCKRWWKKYRLEPCILFSENLLLVGTVCALELMLLCCSSISAIGNLSFLAWQFRHPGKNCSNLFVNYHLGYFTCWFLLCLWSLEDHLRVLQAKRWLISLPIMHKIFLHADLTRTQQAELKHSRDLVIAAWKEGQWAVVRDLRAVIQDSALRDIPASGPNDTLAQMGDKFGGACPPYPLVVGIVMVHFGLHRAHFMMWMGPATFFSS